jgi:integrase
MEGACYLEDGKLTIFKRSGVFYARIRTSASGKYIWRSLKTTIEQTAIRAGVDYCSNWNRESTRALPPKSKLFSTVIDEYIAYRKRDHRHGKTSAGMLRQIVRVSKFWREYAGTMAIDAIDDKVMQEFPSMEAIHAFWNSPKYVPKKKLRQDAATANIGLY